MSIKKLLATFGLVAFVTPAFADIPDGHGGRTSIQASMQKQPVTAATMRSCCKHAATTAPKQVASSPAELKAQGHLAWVKRTNDPAYVAPCCRTGATYGTAQYRSPAELKAFGHLAPRESDRVTTATNVRPMPCC